MSKVNSTNPTSRRMYLSQDELEQFADITVTDTAEADDQISQAEELIDSFIGFQKTFWDTNFGSRDLIGKATGGSLTTVTLQTKHQNLYELDFFIYTELEIIRGTGIGQRRSVSSSTKAGVITVVTAFTTAPDSTSYYRINQLGKFPRQKDAFLDSDVSPLVWAKFVPEQVKRAVAAQVEYSIEMGASFFKSDASDKTREKLDDYEYEKGSGNQTVPTLYKLISPKSRQLLRGFVNRKGQFSDVIEFSNA